MRILRTWLCLLLTFWGGSVFAQATPPFNPQEISGMLSQLQEAMQQHAAALKPDGTIDPAVAQDIASKLSSVDFSKLQNFQGALGQISQADLLSYIPNMSTFNGVLDGLANGSLLQTLNGAYSGLNSLYQNPNLSQAERQQIYDQMKNLYDGIANKGAIQGIADSLQGNITNILNAAGFNDLVNSLGQIAQGNIQNPQDIANMLTNMDWQKLNDLMQQLGSPGFDELKKFLPAGMDPALLDSAFNAFKNGGIDALLDNLVNALKDKIANALPGDLAGLQDALDKLNALKDQFKNNPLGAIGGLLTGLLGNNGNNGNSNIPANCNTNALDNVMIDIMNSGGSLTRPPGLVICK